ncbi:MAG: type II toxin-antitoxin system RelE/ParE family toxin [Promicromonosporaceae bacterium]|nr:type II toxin-antitoxin system RelE/ParE family toxin [Promicromonosporaceae bacterium]
MVWTVFTGLIDEWLLALDKDTYVQVNAALTILATEGPHLGRPLVDTIVGSRHNNMKELRPGSSRRSEVRILFAFDPTRSAIMLLGGDKSGQWAKWYRKAIPEADKLYDQHLKDLATNEGKQR